MDMIPIEEWLTDEEFIVDKHGRFVITDPEILGQINGALKPFIDTTSCNSSCTNNGC